MGSEVHVKKYKAGMYGGAFNPLHLGHLDCMIRAAGLCERLYIVISYRPKTLCGASTEAKMPGDMYSDADADVDVRIKYRWVYQLTKHLGNVTILTLEDRTDSKAGYTREYWQSDCEKVKATIGEKLDAVFCGSDYDENSFWNICYPESELVIFPRSGFCSTEIRRDLYGNWEKMPSEVRAYFVRKVLIIGGESVGKSTLTINLAQRFSTNYLEEVGRELSELSGTDEMMIGEDYLRILLEHKIKEINISKDSNKVLFEDTDCLTTRFYMEFLEGDRSPENVVLAEAIAATNRYDLILFLEPDVKWVQDGDRSLVIEANRQKYSQRIKDIYAKHGFHLVSVEGGYVERFEKATALVDDLLKKSHVWLIADKSLPPAKGRQATIMPEAAG